MNTEQWLILFRGIAFLVISIMKILCVLIVMSCLLLGILTLIDLLFQTNLIERVNNLLFEYEDD